MHSPLFPRPTTESNGMMGVHEDNDIFSVYDVDEMEYFEEKLVHVIYLLWFSHVCNDALNVD